MEDKVNKQPSVGPSNSTGAIRKVKRSKRDLRSWDHLMKSIGDLSEDEKFDVIKEKYCDLHNEFQTMASTLKAIEKQLQALQRDKEHVQADLTKNILSRSKMESLARELQKQNKEIKEENSNRLKEEEDKRKEVAATFTEKLNGLTQLMDDNKDKSLRLREENIKLTSKLTELYDQFQERENHLSNMNRQMELQKKLSDTQMKKLGVEFETEREIWQKERSILLSNLEKSEETNKLLQENVNTLQFHIDVYQKQYAEFEITMKKSNKVFDSFKDEMTKMQKANATLEKDRNEWHQRWKAATQSALNLTELHQECSSDLETAQRKIKMLERLCRKLQVERSAYLCQLKDNNIIPVTSPPHFEEEAGAIHEISLEKEKPLNELQPTAQKKENMGLKKQVLEMYKMEIAKRKEPKNIKCDTKPKIEEIITSDFLASATETLEEQGKSLDQIHEENEDVAEFMNASPPDPTTELSVSGLNLKDKTEEKEED